MTIGQIAAILYLLLAFGVDQPTVDNIKAILEAQNKTIQVEQVSAPKQTTAIGSPAVPNQDACAESLTLSVPKPEITRTYEVLTQEGWKYLEGFSFKAQTASVCGKDWILEYEYNSGTYSLPSGGYATEVVRGKFEGSGNQIKQLLLASRLPGTYYVSFVAKSLDGSVTTATTTKNFTSHGYVSQEQLDQYRAAQ